MRRFFADTFYWVALLLRRDSWHRRVTAFSCTLTNEEILFTTDAVLLEFLAALSAAGPYLRQQAATHVEGMLADPSMRVVEVTRALFLDGLALYQSRPDKEYRRMYSLYGVRRLLPLSLRPLRSGKVGAWRYRTTVQRPMPSCWAIARGDQPWRWNVQTCS